MGPVIELLTALSPVLVAVLGILGSALWPAALIIAVILFRRELSGLLDRIEGVNAAGFELKAKIAEAESLVHRAAEDTSRNGPGRSEPDASSSSPVDTARVTEGQDGGQPQAVPISTLRQSEAIVQIVPVQAFEVVAQAIETGELHPIEGLLKAARLAETAVNDIAKAVQAADGKSPESLYVTPVRAANVLLDAGVVDREWVRAMRSLWSLRNTIVHSEQPRSKVDFDTVAAVSWVESMLTLVKIARQGARKKFFRLREGASVGGVETAHTPPPTSTPGATADRTRTVPSRPARTEEGA